MSVDRQVQVEKELKEVEKWERAYVISGVLLFLEIVTLLYLSICKGFINGMSDIKSTTVFWTLAILLLVVTNSWNRVALKNYWTFWRLKESYRHTRWVLRTFHALHPKCKAVVERLLMEPTVRYDTDTASDGKSANINLQTTMISPCQNADKNTKDADIQLTSQIVAPRPVVLHETKSAKSATYRLVEMVVECLEDDPSERMFR